VAGVGTWQSRRYRPRRSEPSRTVQLVRPWGALPGPVRLGWTVRLGPRPVGSADDDGMTNWARCARRANESSAFGLVNHLFC
jgi:hypothetical protein